MPILTLRREGPPMLPVIGHIRKGDPKSASGQMGRDRTSFRFEPVFSGKSENDRAWAQELMDRWENAFGKEPRAIPVFFPYPEPTANLDDWMLLFSAAGLQRKCDGVNVHQQLVNGQHVFYGPGEMPCICAAKGLTGAKACKQTARLYVIVPQLGELALVIVHTTSKLDIMTLEQNLTAAALVLGGNINGVPFVLQRAPRMISTPTEGGRMQREKYLLSARVHPNYMQKRMGQFLTTGMVSGYLPEKSGAYETPLLVDGQHGAAYHEEALEVSEEMAQEVEREEEVDALITQAREQVLEAAQEKWGSTRAPGGLAVWVERLTAQQPRPTNSLYDLDETQLSTLLDALVKSIAKDAGKTPAAQTPEAAPAVARKTKPSKVPVQEDGPAETPAPDGDEEDGSDDDASEGAYREIEGITS